MKNIIVGTAGHIDHGKTALVKALTGIDADRLKEEKERGITIDLGYAHIDLGDIRFGFIDVPGHERFVKNMLAGACGIDLVILVVAADESVMPQTREHFDICKLLGIQSGLIVITKQDLVEKELLDLVKVEVDELVSGSFLEDAEVVAVSSKTGEGIEVLKRALERSALQLKEKQSNGLFRLPIDRAFSIRGFGTVVTGTLISGQVARDEEVEILPTSLKTRVRGIQVYGQSAAEALAGQRTAVNLHNIEVQQVERGMVLAHSNTLYPSSLLDVKLNLLPSASKAVKNLSRVRFHHGTSEIVARVMLLGQDVLEPGANCYGQLRLERPTVAILGDPFIIRKFSPAVTIGGGIIVENRPQKHKHTDERVRAFLNKIENADTATRLAYFIKEAEGGIAERDLIARFGLMPKQLANLIEGGKSTNKIKVVSKNPFYLIGMEAYDSLCGKVIRELERFHDENPLVLGLSKEMLRKELFGNFPFELFRSVLDELSRVQKISVSEDVVSLFGRQLNLTKEEQKLKQEIESLYLETGVQPPTPQEVIDKFISREKEDKIKKIFYLLIKEKILVKISEDLIFHRENIAVLKDKLLQKFPKGSKLNIGAFKDTFNISRKYAIPLLEYLDKERITRRMDADRIIL